MQSELNSSKIQYSSRCAPQCQKITVYICWICYLRALRSLTCSRMEWHVDQGRLLSTIVSKPRTRDSLRKPQEEHHIFSSSGSLSDPVELWARLTLSGMTAIMVTIIEKLPLGLLNASLFGPNTERRKEFPPTTPIPFRYRALGWRTSLRTRQDLSGRGLLGPGPFQNAGGNWRGQKLLPLLLSTPICENYIWAKLESVTWLIT